MKLLSRIRMRPSVSGWLFLIIPILFFALGCGPNDSASDLGPGRGNDVTPPDDDIGDDDGGDDGGDDDDSGDDDDDDTEEVVNIVLKFDPDPANGDHYYSGARFDISLELYGGEGQLLGTSTDYTLNISPNETGVTYDIVAGTIRFAPPQPTHYEIMAAYPGAKLNSNTVAVYIEFESIAKITLQSPPRGLFTQDPSVNVQGDCYLDYESPLPCEKVRVNGTYVSNAPQPDGKHSHFLTGISLVEGLNRILVEATDNDGIVLGNVKISVLYGHYLPNGQIADYAVAARVNEGGLDTLEAIAEDYANSINLGDYIPNPLFDIDLVICQMTLVATNAAIGGVDIALSAEDGYIDLSGAINNLNISVTDQGDCIDSGSITASTMGVAADVYPFVQPDGTLGVELAGITVNTDNLTANGFGAIGDLINTLWPLLSAYISDLLKQMIDDELTPLIQEQLNNLDLSGAFQLLGKDFHAEAEFQEVSVDVNGLTAWMKSKIAADQVDPGVPVFPGSFRVSSLHPDLGPQTPRPPVVPYDFGVALNDDILNQALYEVYRAGLLNFTFSDPALTTTTLALIFPQLFLLYPGDPVILDLEPLLPPVITMSFTKEAAATLAIGEYLLKLTVDDPDDGLVEAFTSAITLIFPVTVSVDDDGLLRIDINPDDFQVDVSVLDELTDMGFTNGLVEDLIPTLLELLVPYLGDLLGGIALPTFEGYQLNIEDLQAFGYANDYLGLFGALAPAP